MSHQNQEITQQPANGYQAEFGCPLFHAAQQALLDDLELDFGAAPQNEQIIEMDDGRFEQVVAAPHFAQYSDPETAPHDQEIVELGDGHLENAIYVEEQEVAPPHFGQYNGQAIAQQNGQVVQHDGPQEMRALLDAPIVEMNDHLDAQPNAQQFVQYYAPQPIHQQGTPGQSIQNSAPQVARRPPRAPRDAQPDEDLTRMFGNLEHISKLASKETPRVLTMSTVTLPKTSSIYVNLKNYTFWMKLHKALNEMQVSNKGRSLFPHLGFDFEYLNPGLEYVIGVRLVPKSDNLFQFSLKKGEWVEVRSNERQKATNVIYSTPLLGTTLMKRGFVFENLKIFNVGDEKRKATHLRKTSVEEGLEQAKKGYEKQANYMFQVVPRCKYLPELTLYTVDPSDELIPVHCISFGETLFIASAGYKNPIIKKMKTVANKHSTEKNKMRNAGGSETQEPTSTATSELMGGSALLTPAPSMASSPQYNWPHYQ